MMLSGIEILVPIQETMQITKHIVAVPVIARI